LLGGPGRATPKLAPGGTVAAEHGSAAPRSRVRKLATGGATLLRLDRTGPPMTDRSRSASGVAAHAIGDGQHPPARIRRVLVAVADHAHVRPCGEPNPDRHARQPTTATLSPRNVRG